MHSEKEEKAIWPDIPEEIRSARIGTCFNSITRNTYNIIAIDPDRLKRGAVIFNSGKGKLQLKMNATTNSTAEGSFFGLDSKVKINCLPSKVSVGFSTSIASSSSTNNQSLNCYCSYVYKGQSLKLLDYGSKELYNYMSDDFQEALSKVLNSKDVLDCMSNYIRFTERFGHGCVTQLYLTSGSAFMIDVQYADQAETNSKKYGGSISISKPWGGGSVAAEFAKEVSSASSTAEMNLIAEQMPETTPTQAWCSEIMGSVMNAGFSKLAKEPNLVKPYTGEVPKAPDIPDGEPSKKEEPSGTKFDISEDLKEKYMKDDGFSGTWEEYEEAQKKKYEELTDKKAVKEALNLRQNSTGHSSIFNVAPMNKTHIETPAGSDPWCLEGYIPFAYKVTAWSELFPQLKDIKLPSTFTSIYIAKIYIYFLTRLHFSNYLYFLADVGGKICKNDSIAIDAQIYKNACDDFLNKIHNYIEQYTMITEEDYILVVEDFERMVSELQHFYSKKAYKTFFDKYDFFVENSYGFLYVDWFEDSKKYRVINGGSKNVPTPFSLLPMLKDGMRYYPVILNDGTCQLACYANVWSLLPVTTYGDPIEDPKGFYYYRIEKSSVIQPDSSRIYGVGFKDIPANVELKVNGLPMFGDLPFEETKEFAKPRF